MALGVRRLTVGQGSFVALFENVILSEAKNPYDDPMKSDISGILRLCAPQDDISGVGILRPGAYPERSRRAPPDDMKMDDFLSLCEWLSITNNCNEPIAAMDGLNTESYNAPDYLCRVAAKKPDVRQREHRIARSLSWTRRSGLCPGHFVWRFLSKLYRLADNGRFLFLYHADVFWERQERDPGCSWQLEILLLPDHH
jgi:hypothetical protein